MGIRTTASGMVETMGGMLRRVFDEGILASFEDGEFRVGGKTAAELTRNNVATFNTWGNLDVKQAWEWTADQVRSVRKHVPACDEGGMQLVAVLDERLAEEARQPGITRNHSDRAWVPSFDREHYVSAGRVMVG